MVAPMIMLTLLIIGEINYRNRVVVIKPGTVEWKIIKNKIELD